MAATIVKRRGSNKERKGEDSYRGSSRRQTHWAFVGESKPSFRGVLIYWPWSLGKEVSTKFIEGGNWILSQSEDSNRHPPRYWNRPHVLVTFFSEGRSYYRVNPYLLCMEGWALSWPPLGLDAWFSSMRSEEPAWHVGILLSQVMDQTNPSA